MSKDVKRVVHLSTNVGKSCEHCDELVGGAWANGADVGSELAKSINHYIEKHGYKLLHVGTETTDSHDGKPWQTTVAVLGSDSPPALKPPPKPLAIEIAEQKGKS